MCLLWVKETKVSLTNPSFKKRGNKKMDNKQRIPKLIVRADQIEGSGCFGLTHEEEMYKCYDCGGMIFYVKKILGIVAEESDFQIMGYRSKRRYSICPIGFNIYCSECSCFREDFSSFQYDKDAVVCSYDDIDGEEIAEIEFCLRQFNEKGNFTPLFATGESRVLKEKLMEYEKEHPIKVEKKKIKKVRKKKKK